VARQATGGGTLSAEFPRATMRRSRGDAWAQGSGVVITTFAGGPRNGAATEGAVSPDAVAVHGAVVYVADQLRHVVYRVDAGQRSVVAGLGYPGFSGDGGPAREAALNMPGGLAVDAVGNLFIGDTRNRRVRTVSATDGTIRTIAGTDPDAPGGHDLEGQDGKATETRLDLPTAVAVDASGTVFVADSGNDRILAIRADGTIALSAGTGETTSDDDLPATEARLVLPTGDPYGIAVDAAGAVYIPEPFDRRVRRLDPATGVLTTVAGSLSLDSALDTPIAVAVAAGGTVAIADRAKSVVLRLAPDGQLSPLAGTGTAGSAGDGGSAAEAQLQNPCAVAGALDGTLLVGDRGNARVRRVDPQTHVISTVAGNGPPLLAFFQPQGLAVDQHDTIYVSDIFPRVFRIDGGTGDLSHVAGSDPGFSGDGGPARDAELQDPWRLSVDAAGNLYISDHGNRRVRKVDAGTGVISTVAGNGQLTGLFTPAPAIRTPLNFLLGTCVDAAGNLYIADAGFHCVHRVDAATGMLSTVAGDVDFGEGTKGFSGDGRPASKARLSSPTAVAVDAAGTLYIADAGNHRIRRVDAQSRVITTLAGGGDRDAGTDAMPANRVALGRPVQLALHGEGGLLVSDSDSHQVLLVDLAAETVRRVAGTGEAGFSGDGGPGPEARLWAPMGIAVDSAGRVLIADSGNQRVRRLEGL
jgi:sugar lactone lactonase YvrE